MQYIFFFFLRAIFEVKHLGRLVIGVWVYVWWDNQVESDIFWAILVNQNKSISKCVTLTNLYFSLIQISSNVTQILPWCMCLVYTYQPRCHDAYIESGTSVGKPHYFGLLFFHNNNIDISNINLGIIYIPIVSFISN